jgi:hypothetical protein
MSASARSAATRVIRAASGPGTAPVFPEAGESPAPPVGSPIPPTITPVVTPPPPPPPPPSPRPTPNGLRVSGNRLLDDDGNVVQLRGVNRSGTEYACIQGWGFFDGPADDAAVAAIRAWKSNLVRVPINETCWLGINGVDPRYGGENYRREIEDFVARINRHGMYAELSLMWAAPGSYKATYQPGAPNADHSPEVWAGLASRFKDHRNVILAPWGETIVDARCFRDGGVCAATYGPGNVPYKTAGMQQAVGVMRAAGYKGVIAIPGISYANDLSRWLEFKPVDPMNQLIAEAHVYGKNACDNVACFDATYGPVAAQVPLLFGEFGETYDDSAPASTTYTERILTWADAHGVGYAAWTWNVWGTAGSLVSDFSGTPANVYGEFIRAHYAAKP